MNMHSKSAFIIATVLLTSCATPLQPNEVEVRIESRPKGALIYSGSKALGESPVRVKFTATEQMIRNGFGLSDVYSVWPSGAKATQTLRINIGQGIQSFVISRPADAPGIEIDLGVKNSNNGSGSGYTNPLWELAFPTYTHTSCIRTGVLTQCTSK